MRTTVLSICFALIATGQSLAQACPSGSPSAISVAAWSVENDPAGARIRLELRNDMANAIRLLDATAYVEDILGGRIGHFALDRAVRAEPGQTFQYEGNFVRSQIGNVFDMHPDDVVVFVCTSAVVYGDGTADSSPRGAISSSILPEGAIEQVAAAMRRCWNPPIASITANIAVELQVKLDENGSVISAEPLSPAADDLELSVALSAQRAVQMCGPYTMLPTDAYDHWETMTISFSTRDL